MMRLVLIILATICTTSAWAGTCVPTQESDGKSVFWGDLHIHTSFSMDAYVWDNQLSPADAYRFAKGHGQKLLNGSTVKLDRPLDFAAVTDHAEYFGVTYACQIENPDSPYCQGLDEVAKEASPRGFYEYFLPALLAGDRLCQNGEEKCPEAERSLWERVQTAANEANDPCQFTAFIANEWTPSPGNLHWHRNLIYANADVPLQPINSFDYPDQRDLWRGLTEACIGECEVLAIPHNSNLGMGGTFDLTDHDVEDLTARARFEKLVEIHQHKGASECIAGISTAANFADEDCDFEIMLPIPLLRKQAAAVEAGDTLDPFSESEKMQVAQGYVRNTLLRGLEQKSVNGINPFVYGIIGSTDTHSARPGAVEEQGWSGAIGTYDEDPERRSTYTHYNPGGLAAVWAEENTREAIFTALKNRETYATSGPRIELRFEMYDGTADCSASGGTAMGGTYDSDEAPVLLVRTRPDKTRLSRVDLIKLTYQDGQMQQSLVRNTLSEDDLKEGAYCVTHRDTTFDPDVPTAWYVRVLEAPTMRWDGLKEVRERAWSSPIWSTSAVN